MQLYMKQASKKCWRRSRFFKTLEELASFGWALGYPPSFFWVIVGPLPFSICTQPDVLLEIFIRDSIKWPRATGTGETPQRSGSRLSHRDRLPSTLWRTCCVSNSVDKLQSWAWVEKNEIGEERKTTSDGRISPAELLLVTWTLDRTTRFKV